MATQTIEVEEILYAISCSFCRCLFYSVSVRFPPESARYPYAILWNLPIAFLEQTKTTIESLEKVSDDKRRYGLLNLMTIS
ncbi:hypothetical protein ACTXT7_006569 [Hymenolepis weldensis]